MRRMVTALTFNFAVAALFVLTTPKPAMALPCCVDEVTFYSDCTYTTVIGYMSLSCYGHLTKWGYTEGGPQYLNRTGCNNPNCCYEGDPACDYQCQDDSGYFCLP